MEERFWKKVKKSEGCWEWTAYLDHKGYGGFTVDGRMQKAHRVAYELHHKTTIELGLVVRHKCDNRKCCNPNHLETGTHQDNVNDRNQRNRQSKGESHPTAKLTEEKVIEIKHKLNEGNTARSIADEYAVAHQTIHGIKIGKYWKHIIVN
jgi:hypothetical protein